MVPELVTRKVQWIVSPRSVRPSALMSVTVADLTRSSADDWAMAGVGRGRVRADASSPPGVTAEPVAVLETTPASTSAWVTVWALDVQVTDAPGASDPAGQVTGPAVGSLTAGAVRVAVPVFFSTKRPGDRCRRGRTGRRR